MLSGCPSEVGGRTEGSNVHREVPYLYLGVRWEWQRGCQQRFLVGKHVRAEAGWFFIEY